MMKRRGFCVFTAALAISCINAAGQTEPPSVESRMRQLLQLPDAGITPTAELIQSAEDGDARVEYIRFLAERDVWVPATVMKPLQASARLPAIICLPGTGGTRQQLTFRELRFAGHPHTGWARALALQGFVTLSLDYRGSPAREQNIFIDAIRSLLEGRNYMGSLVQEVIRAVDYISTRADVDKTRIGITGFSLGGAISWYAAAADPRLVVIVPVCGGAGTYKDLLNFPKKVDYHSQYFYPAAFLKLFPDDQPEVFASFAPRALLVIGRDQDQGMPIEGLRLLEEQVRKVYVKRGAESRFAVQITPGEHAYTGEMFEQVRLWFDRFLQREK
jgi:dienelactone hydrolase